ncbi:hypothetical protein [Amycolatopsis sp. NPDC059021]
MSKKDEGGKHGDQDRQGHPDSDPKKWVDPGKDDGKHPEGRKDK